MGPSRSSSLRIGGDSSAIPDSGRTSGEPDYLDVVALRDAPGEPPLPLGKGDELKSHPFSVHFSDLFLSKKD